MKQQAAVFPPALIHIVLKAFGNEARPAYQGQNLHTDNNSMLRKKCRNPFFEGLRHLMLNVYIKSLLLYIFQKHPLILLTEEEQRAVLRSVSL